MKIEFESLSEPEKELINAFDLETPFRVLQTNLSEDLEILRKPSIQIEPNTLDLAYLIQRMYTTVTAEKFKGVGIAAPQIGINRQIIWVQRIDKPDHPFEFYINPKIIWKSDVLREGDEGCLSIPETYGTVKRCLVVTIEYQDLKGKIFTETVEGFVAVIFQHEIDHLKGILFTDYLKTQASLKYIDASEKHKLFYNY